MCQINEQNYSIYLDSDEAEKNGSASQAVSEESVHEAETQASHNSEAQPSHDSEATGKNLDKELEQTDETDKTTENNKTALDDINIAIYGGTDDTPSEDSSHLLEDLRFALSNWGSNQPLIQQEDSKAPDNETESVVKEDVEDERTGEVKPSEGDKGQKEDSSDDTEESDFVDAQAINGIEMLPSSDINADDSDASGKIDCSAEKASKETVNQDDEEITLSCNDAAKSSFVDSTESSNEENSEEPELQFTTDREGSQDDLLSSPPDSSSYETPRSSETSPSATSENESKVVTIQPTVNGVSCRNSVTDGAPIPPSRKNKKKGLSTASLGGCFPMACAGNASPTFTLSRNDSVYGGSVRSRFVAHVRN